MQTPAEKNIGTLLQHGLSCKTKCFPGQRADEKVEAILTRHWIVLVVIIFYAILAGLVVYLADLGIKHFLPAGSKIDLVVLFFIVNLVTHIFFFCLFNFYYLKIVIITNLRIIDIQFSTVFKRNLDALDLHNIQDINVSRKGILRWLFNFGRIIMHNSSGSELFDFKYLKNPLKNYNIINHVHFKALNNQIERKTTQTSPSAPIAKTTLLDWNEED